MGNTPIYGFGYIEPNQDLSENIDLDELRFKAIENQMYNLYQIFKNGIIKTDAFHLAILFLKYLIIIFLFIMI